MTRRTFARLTTGTALSLGFTKSIKAGTSDELVAISLEAALSSQIIAGQAVHLLS